MLGNHWNSGKASKLWNEWSKMIFLMSLFLGLGKIPFVSYRENKILRNFYGFNSSTNRRKGILSLILNDAPSKACRYFVKSKTERWGLKFSPDRFRSSIVLIHVLCTLIVKRKTFWSHLKKWFNSKFCFEFKLW